MRRIPVLLLLLATACGGDGDDPTVGGPPSPTPTTTGTPSPAESAVTEIKAADFSFAPRTLTVPAGTTVTVRNVGRAPHTWTRKPDFDVPLDERDATGSFTFARPGSYDYVCTIHEAQGMTGVVVVT